jgi:hypothetical protein
MVGSWDPEGHPPLHSSPAYQYILYGIVETVSYVKYCSNVWWRNNYHIWIYARINDCVWINREAPILIPKLNPTFLYISRIEPRWKWFSHCISNLSYFHLPKPLKCFVAIKKLIGM